VSDYSAALSELSPEKRELLELMLSEESTASEPLPLSFAQQRLWFIDQLEPGSFLYNICSSVRLQGRLDARALERCFAEIVRRHEVLRTTFAMVDRLPVQTIADDWELRIQTTDLEDLPDAERDREVQRLTLEEAQAPFNLSRGPLLRVKLLRLSDHEHILLLTMHHIISDGWSMAVIVREVATLYDAYCQGRPSPLAELPIQYADVVIWQRDWLQGKVLDEQLAYWKKQLADAPSVLELPTNRARPAINTYAGRRQHFTLSPQLSEAVKSLNEREGVTMFMTLLSAFVILLHRYTTQTDIVVGTPVANRTRAETEDLIGLFVNTLVLRTDVSGDPSFGEVLRRVRETSLDAYAHQDLPFERIVEELQPKRDLSRTPVFQVLFAVQNAGASMFEASGLTLTPMEVENGTSKFDISLFLAESVSGLVGAIEYNTDLFEPEMISRLLSHYEHVLECATARPDVPISQLPILVASRDQAAVGRVE